MALTLFTLAVSNLVDICHAPRFASAGLVFRSIYINEHCFYVFFTLRVFVPIEIAARIAKKVANRERISPSWADYIRFFDRTGPAPEGESSQHKKMQYSRRYLRPSLIRLATWRPTAAMAQARGQTQTCPWTGGDAVRRTDIPHRLPIATVS